VELAERRWTEEACCMSRGPIARLRDPIHARADTDGAHYRNISTSMPKFQRQGPAIRFSMNRSIRIYYHYEFRAPRRDLSCCCARKEAEQKWQYCVLPKLGRFGEDSPGLSVMRGSYNTLELDFELVKSAGAKRTMMNAVKTTSSSATTRPTAANIGAEPNLEAR
jgi:hypothetical protein